MLSGVIFWRNYVCCSDTTPSPRLGCLRPARCRRWAWTSATPSSNCSTSWPTHSRTSSAASAPTWTTRAPCSTAIWSSTRLNTTPSVTPSGSVSKDFLIGFLIKSSCEGELRTNIFSGMMSAIPKLASFFVGKSSDKESFFMNSWNDKLHCYLTSIQEHHILCIRLLKWSVALVCQLSSENLST